MSVIPLAPAPNRSTAPAADGMLRRLAGSLAHHVNNALTATVGYLELALRQTPAGTEAHRNLQTSLACAHRAADTVKRIVAFANRTPGTEALAPLPLRAVAVLAAEQLRSRELPGLIVTVEGTSAGWVQASLSLLQSALEPLLCNAVEAMPGGGKLALVVEEEAGRCCLRVRDTGGGVAPEVLAHLFEPFVTSKGGHHLGLGLVFSRELMQAQGGGIDVRSVAGEGTTVTLSLPTLEANSLIRVDAASPLVAGLHWPAVSCGL